MNLKRTMKISMATMALVGLFAMVPVANAETPCEEALQQLIGSTNPTVEDLAAYLGLIASVCSQGTLADCNIGLLGYVACESGSLSCSQADAGGVNWNFSEHAWADAYAPQIAGSVTEATNAFGHGVGKTQYGFNGDTASVSDTMTGATLVGDFAKASASATSSLGPVVMAHRNGGGSVVCAQLNINDLPTWV